MNQLHRSPVLEVPPFLSVDGVSFPIASDRWGVWIVQDPKALGLRPLSYIAAHLTSQRAASERATELRARKDFQLLRRLSASYVTRENRKFLGNGVRNWASFAGHPPDLDDAYLLGTPLLSDVLVVPRMTLIRLVEQLGALHDAVLTSARRR